MKNETTTEGKRSFEGKKVEISFTTDWLCPDDDAHRYAELRVEKASYYAAAIFELIERSCEPYVAEGVGEISAVHAHKHLISIRELAELGKHLTQQM